MTGMRAGYALELSSQTAKNVKKNRAPGRNRSPPDAQSLCFFPQAVSMPAAFCSFSFSMACSRILYLRILPAAFIGKPSTKSM